MDSLEVRRILSYASERFGRQVFESKQFEECVHSSLDESKKWHKRNCPLKAPVVMRAVFMLIIFRYLSIVCVLEKLIQQFRVGFPSLPIRAITSEALCHARDRLGVEPLRIFFEKQAGRIEPSKLFHGHRVCGVDGSKINIPDTPANEAHFGRPEVSRGRAAYPQMWSVMLVETSTRQVGAVTFASCYTPERDGVLEMLNRLDAGDIAVFDRGLSAAWIFRECRNRSIHFLARISSNWKPKVIERLGGGDFLVTVKGPIPKELQKGQKTVTLELRMLKYQIGDGETVRLLTDLTDSKKYPATELAGLYHDRWECELAFDELKNHLSTTAGGAQKLLFRSKKPDGILQEAYALVAIYNIIRSLMAEAGDLYAVNPLHISFVETVQIMKDTTPRFQTAATENLKNEIIRQMLKDIADCRNVRPRRPRRYPRVVKRKMSNYKLKRQDCREEKTDIAKEMRLVG